MAESLFPSIRHNYMARLRNFLDRVYESTVSWLQMADHGRAARFYRQGQRLQDAGAHPKAVSAFGVAIREDPEYIAAFVLRGISWLRMERFDAAITDFDRAITLDPGEEVAYFNRGLAHYRLGNLDAALDDYGETLGINPDYGSAYVNRGVIYLDQQQYRPALADFARAAKFFPDRREIYTGRGRAAWGLGRMTEAADDFHTALDMQPAHHLTLAYLAELYLDTGAAEAEAMIKQGLRTYPQSDHFQRLWQRMSKG